MLEPRRRRYAVALIAAALAAAAFGVGWLGGARSDDVAADRVIPMAGVNDGRGASASIELLAQDAEENGNWPMFVRVRGLEASKDRADYYELWLTKDGKLVASCGRFTVHAGLTTVMLSVPYGLRRYDDWVITRRGSDEILLTTDLGGRLPELEAVSLRVDGPAEAAELVLLDLVVDLGAGGAELGEHGVEIAHAVVDHHLLGLRPVLGVAGEDRPDGHVTALGLEDGASPLLERDPEVGGVPGAQRVGVAAAEKDTADPGDALHRAQGAVRSFATNAACVIGICSARNRSHASA